MAEAEAENSVIVSIITNLKKEINIIHMISNTIEIIPVNEENLLTNYIQENNLPHFLIIRNTAVHHPLQVIIRDNLRIKTKVLKTKERFNN